MTNSNLTPTVMTTQFNETTNQNEKVFQAELVSISSKVLENANGTKYRVATISLVNAKSEKIEVSAIVYEKNYIDESTGEARMTIGESYRATAAPGDHRGPIVTVSHLTSAARATADLFGFEAVSTPTTVGVSA